MWVKLSIFADDATGKPKHATKRLLGLLIYLCKATGYKTDTQKINSGFLHNYKLT